MASSYSWKLRALLKKNLLIMKRNVFSTLFEIFFPIILMVVLIGLREAFHVDIYNFTEQEKSTELYIQNKSMTNINFGSSEIVNGLWHGMSVLPPLTYCSKSNMKQTPRPLIASIGIPSEIKTQMISDSQIFDSKINFKLTTESFKEFDSIKEMEDYIKDPFYGIPEKPLVCFAMSFFHDTIANKYNYSLHFFDFDSSNGDGISDIYSIKHGMYDDFQSGPNLKAFLSYRNSAYSYMMKLASQYILRKETNDNSASLDYGIIAMKYVDYRVDSFGEFLGYMITLFIVVAYMSPLSLYVFRIVGEKESKSKEGMKIMGLGEGEYFLSYFIQYFTISIFVSLINAGLLKIVLSYTPYYLLFVIFILWSLNVFAFIYFFQSFIDKTRIALVLSLVIYFIMYCLSIACLNETSSRRIKVILSIFPAVSLNVGFLLLSKFEYHFRRFHNREFFESYYNFSTALMILMLICDIFIYLFLGYYLHNVLPHDFGIKKP